MEGGRGTTMRRRIDENLGFDYCSQLCDFPDETLQHILSFLPTKAAVRTSVLSKRWKRLWDVPSDPEQLQTYVLSLLSRLDLCRSAVLSSVAVSLQALKRNISPEANPGINLIIEKVCTYIRDVVELTQLRSQLEEHLESVLRLIKDLREITGYENKLMLFEARLARKEYLIGQALPPVRKIASYQGDEPWRRSAEFLVHCLKFLSHARDKLNRLPSELAKYRVEALLFGLFEGVVSDWKLATVLVFDNLLP